MNEAAQSWIIAALVGYVLGATPFGLLLVRAAGLGDIRAIGSGNIGATNVLRTGKRGIALATLLLDGAKAALAYWAVASVFDRDAGLIAAAAAFFGHCYPVWLRFKGGKGVATFLGALLAAMPLVALIAAAAWLAMAAAFRYSSLGSLAAAAVAPLAAGALGMGPAAIGFCLALAALIYWRHRANISRLLRGEEPRIGAKKPDGA